MNRLLDEIGSLQSRLVAGVRRQGKSLEQVKMLERQINTRKDRVEVLKREYLATLRRKQQIEGAVAPGESPMTIEETRLVAATLKTQRPLIYSTEEWAAFRRICASLAELFAARFAGATDGFDTERFLIDCGLSTEDARRLSPEP